MLPAVAKSPENEAQDRLDALKAWMQARRDCLLMELATLEREIPITPTTKQLRQWFREGRLVPPEDGT